MIYVFENGNNDASVVLDGNTLTEEEKLNAVIVSELPIKEVIKGKVAVLKVSKSEERVWYEHEDMIPTEDGKLVLKVQSLEEENAELLMKSAISEMKMEGLESDISELMVKVATIELGGNI